MHVFFIGVGLGVVALVREYGPKLVAYLKSKGVVLDKSAKADVAKAEAEAKDEITKLESHV